jgi:hypothetical protein
MKESIQRIEEILNKFESLKVEDELENKSSVNYPIWSKNTRIDTIKKEMNLLTFYDNGTRTDEIKDDLKFYFRKDYGDLFDQDDKINIETIKNKINYDISELEKNYKDIIGADSSNKISDDAKTKISDLFSDFKQANTDFEIKDNIDISDCIKGIKDNLTILESIKIEEKFSDKKTAHYPIWSINTRIDTMKKEMDLLSFYCIDGIRTDEIKSDLTSYFGKENVTLFNTDGTLNIEAVKSKLNYDISDLEKFYNEMINLDTKNEISPDVRKLFEEVIKKLKGQVDKFNYDEKNTKTKSSTDIPSIDLSDFDGKLDNVDNELNSLDKYLEDYLAEDKHNMDFPANEDGLAVDFSEQRGKSQEALCTMLGIPKEAIKAVAVDNEYDPLLDMAHDKIKEHIDTIEKEYNALVAAGKLTEEQKASYKSRIDKQRERLESLSNIFDRNKDNKKDLSGEAKPNPDNIDNPDSTKGESDLKPEPIPDEIPPKVDTPTGDLKPNQNEFKVTKKKTVKGWISKHKKQILIALGIAALIALVIVAINALPAATAALTQAQTISSCLTQMTIHGNLWGQTTLLGEQIAQHGANVALAGNIQQLTGLAAAFDTHTGLWTIGGKALADFTASQAPVLAAATAKVAGLKTAADVLGIGGLGLLGTGLLLGNKSDAYKEFVKEIKEETTDSYKELAEKIEASTELSDKEKEVLLRKLEVKGRRKQKAMQPTIDTPDLEEDESKFFGSKATADAMGL